MSHKHVIITGTGRAGTTFLVQLLTNLGLDTGFDSGNMPPLYEGARAGLEADVRNESAPYIAKDPYFCDYVDDVIKSDDIIIEHVFIPMRNLYAAAQSRRYVVESAVSKLSLLKRLEWKIKPHKIPGGLMHTHNKRQQEYILLQQMYKLVLALSKTMIPVTFLHYPRIIYDSEYLYRKMEILLGEIEYIRFHSTFEKTVHVDWVHSFSENDH